MMRDMEMSYIFQMFIHLWEIYIRERVQNTRNEMHKISKFKVK